MKQQMLREVKAGTRGPLPTATFEMRRNRRMIEKERDQERRERRREKMWRVRD